MRPLAGLLTFLLFLCLIHTCIGDSRREMVLLFKGGETEVPYEDESGKIIMRKPLSFRIPAFVGGVFNNKEFLAVFCDARYNGFSDWSFIEAAARTSYGDYRRWSDVEIFAKNTRVSETHSVVGDITAVMNGNKIYALAPHWDESTDVWAFQQSNVGWNPLMIVGTVMNSTEFDDGVSIKWDDGISIKDVLPGTVLGEPGFQFIGGVGNGVVTKNGTIVFPIQVANNKKGFSSSIMYSTNDGSKWQMGETTEAGISECSVVEWGDGNLILVSRSDGGLRKAYESNDLGTTWKESTMFSRVWGNDPSRTGVGSQGSVITVPVDGEDVLLFSHPLNKKGRYSRDNLLLWVSDGQRIVCVGRISEDFKGKSSGYSILAHVGDNLYSVHEINPFADWQSRGTKRNPLDRVIAFSPLPHLFEIVKKTVRAWRKQDAKLQTKGIPTEGLVGFLTDSDTDAVWADRYNCMSANVNGATRVYGGFRFNTTPGSGAQWPVHSQGQNQVYSFTRQQFTIAATVTIHATTEGEDDLLFGASADAEGNRVVIALGYTQEKKWYAVDANDEKITTETPLELEKEYHVALTFANGVGSVYVDGVDISNGNLTSSSTVSINHFYMGGIGKSSTAKGISCTVENVLLFNRALTQNEISGLSSVSRNGKLSEPMPTEEPIIAPEDEESTSATELTIAPEDQKSTSTTELTIAPEDQKSTSTTEPNVNSETLSESFGNGYRKGKREKSGLMEYTETSKAPSMGKRICNKSLPYILHEYRGGTPAKKKARDNVAVVSLSSVTLMCLFHFAIALMSL